VKSKFTVMLFVMALFSGSALAQYFPAQAYVTVLPGQVTVQVYNPHYEPIICNGQVFGQLATGPVLNSFFTEQFMPAGNYRFAYVHTNAFNPFVNGWANIHCRFARWF
jgi:hypothetical protein